MEYGFFDDEEAVVGAPVASTPIPAALPPVGRPTPPEALTPLAPLGPRLVPQAAPLPGGSFPMSIEPMPTQPMRASIPLENGHTLGLSVLAVGIGSALGLTYAGLFGGVGGGLAGGGAVNLLRAYKHFVKGTPADDKEATISATYGVLSVAASIYLFYKGRSSPKPNESKSKNDRLEGLGE